MKRDYLNAFAEKAAQAGTPHTRFKARTSVIEPFTAL